MPEINRHYSVKEGKEEYPRRAMVKAMIFKKIMVKTHITSDYDNNIPLAKKVCGGTDDDDRYLEGMLRQTSISAKKNMEE
jgi:hypothetical protein